MVCLPAQTATKQLRARSTQRSRHTFNLKRRQKLQMFTTGITATTIPGVFTRVYAEITGTVHYNYTIRHMYILRVAGPGTQSYQGSRLCRGLPQCKLTQSYQGSHLLIKVRSENFLVSRAFPRAKSQICSNGCNRASCGSYMMTKRNS